MSNNRQSKEYRKNILNNSVVFECDFTRLIKGVPNLKSLLQKGNFSEEFINDVFENRNNTKTTVSYAPSFIENREKAELLIQSFEGIFELESLKSSLKGHEDELVFLSLLLYDSYWINKAGEPLNVYNLKQLFEDTADSDLPIDILQVKIGKEVASLIKVVFELKVNLGNENKNPPKPPTISYNKLKAIISNQNTIDLIIDSLEEGLKKGTFMDLGCSLMLVNDYFNLVKDEDFRNNKMGIEKLNHQIDKILNMPFKSPTPLINKVISTISLLVRQYLVINNVIDEKNVTPNLLLIFLEEIFYLLGIYDHNEFGTSNSRKKLGKTIRDYI